MSVPLGPGFDSIALAFVAGVAVALVARFVRRRTPADGSCDLPDAGSFDQSEPEFRAWLASIRRTTRRAANFIPSTLRSLTGFAIGSLGGLIVFFFWLATGNEGQWVSAVASLGRLLLLGWLLAIGWLIRGQWSGNATTGELARLWDIVSFWPRWFLPYAPPQYGARAIKDLQVRVGEYLDGEVKDDDGHAIDNAKLVLAGHSQGSVLVASTVLSMEADACGQVGLLTYGSPLSSIYGKAFPGFFGPETFGRLAEKLEADDDVRWRNLYRQTDFVGGPIVELRDDRIDRGLCDPFQVPMQVQDREAVGDEGDAPGDAPPVLGHDEYEATAYYAWLRRDLLRLL